MRRFCETCGKTATVGVAARVINPNGTVGAYRLACSACEPSTLTGPFEPLRDEPSEVQRRVYPLEFARAAGASARASGRRTTDEQISVTLVEMLRDRRTSKGV